MDKSQEESRTVIHESVLGGESAKDGISILWGVRQVSDFMRGNNVNSSFFEILNVI